MNQPRKQVLVFRELPPAQLARLQAAHHVTLANPRAGQRGSVRGRAAAGAGLIGSSWRVRPGRPVAGAINSFTGAEPS